MSIITKVVTKVDNKPTQLDCKISVNFDCWNTDNGSVGVQSFVHWNNAEAIAALNQMFNVGPNEKIANVTVSAQGITARFETIVD